MSRFKTYLNWSSGKDAALALYRLMQNKSFDVEHLLTTVTSGYDRVTMHGLRKKLLLAQIEAIGLPHSIVELPQQCNMSVYEHKILEAVTVLKHQSFTHSAFGDIFLEDLKVYREEQLKRINLKAVFPLWKKDSLLLLDEFIELGFKAIVVCANSTHFDKSFVGTIIDKHFASQLPEHVDPCGENGEFHTFCFDGPIFKNPISFSIAETIYREYDTPKTDTNTSNTKSGFWYCDLLP